MTLRIALVALCLFAANVLLTAMTRTEVVPPRSPFAAFPMEIEAWQGRRGADFDEAILEQLGVDEYVNAGYASPTNGLAGLYIGYYHSQRQGDTIHSPANCLPGSGWQPIKTGRLTIAAPQQASSDGQPLPVDINRWVIQKSEDRQVVLYWYQSHGRIIASEYWGKFYLIFDAIRLNRTDGALVRVISPAADHSEGALLKAEQNALAFVKVLVPLLNRFLPA